MFTDKFLMLAFSICVFASLLLGWDTDGNYLRQGLLVFAGYALGGVFMFLVSED